MRFAVLAITFVALGAAPTLVRAQAPALDGSYVLASDGGAVIHRAIESAIARMNFVIRPIARGRLRKTNVPYQRLRIATTPEEITTVANDGSPVVSPTSGTRVKWRREDGEVFEVATTWEGRSLSQWFIAEDGRRQNLYSLDADGRTLSLAVTLESPRLATPVKYTLTYRKADLP